MAERSQHKGFTLIELIIVIIISGILAVGSARFIAHTIGGYSATGVRQGNAAIGVVAMEKLSREIRQALPNSVRTYNGGACIEFVPVLFAARYTSAPIAPAAAGTSVSFIDRDPDYTLSGLINEYAVIYPSSVGAIYSPGTTTPITNTQIASVTATGMTLGANHQFPTDSPAKRVYIVSDPVSYCYASVLGETGIFRYDDYGFNATMTTPPTTGNRDLLVNNINSGTVSFSVVPATLVRNALVEISFQVSVPVSYASANETLYMHQEVQIRNVP